MIDPSSLASETSTLTGWLEIALGGFAMLARVSSAFLYSSDKNFSRLFFRSAFADLRRLTTTIGAPKSSSKSSMCSRV